MARLEWELTQRKQLAALCDELTENKKAVASSIALKQTRLDNLAPQLHSILEVFLIFLKDYSLLLIIHIIINQFFFARQVSHYKRVLVCYWIKLDKNIIKQHYLHHLYMFFMQRHLHTEMHMVLLFLILNIKDSYIFFNLFSYYLFL